MSLAKQENRDKPHILCTGGAGYIGSHTVIRLIEDGGWNVTILDNLCNSSERVHERINELCEKEIPFLNINLLDKDAVKKVFKEHRYDAVIHYAGLKAVGESVEKPLMYYQNNLIGTLNLIEAMDASGCKTMVFSSSATVYRPSERPIAEEHPLGPSNPYGQTKFFIEQMLQDISVADPAWKISILRYFNPVGAHSSGRIGESPEMPMNLLPYIQQVAVGRHECVNIFGNDWGTPDGTGVRDYLHVNDLADGHIAALRFLKDQPSGVCAVHNLGTGRGVSVLEMVRYFEAACGKTIPTRITKRRPGDLASVVADPSKAQRDLKWKATRTIQEACASAWKWQSQNPYGYA